MEFEVVPRRGEVRIRDARAAYGEAFNGLARVDVLVLDVEGQAPVAARIELVQVAAGRGVHRAFACPRCREPRLRLIARAGELRCSRCDRTRTRRQLERTTADWCRRGAREEDRLLRLLATSSLPDARLAEAGDLVREILTADLQRLEAIWQEVQVIACCLEIRK